MGHYEDLMMQTALGFDRPFGIMEICISEHDSRKAHRMCKALVVSGDLRVVNPELDGRLYKQLRYEWIND